MPELATAPARSWRELYPVHPCADAFPMMSDDKIDELAADITAHGLREHVVIWPDKHGWQVLDGRNRLEAMTRAGFTFDRPGSVECKGPDGRVTLFARQATGAMEPAAYVISLNLHRRHLTKEQQSELIVKTIEAGRIDRATPARSFNPSPTKKGGSTKDPVLEQAVTEAAKHGISKRTVQNARAKLKGKPTPKMTITLAAESKATTVMPVVDAAIATVKPSTARPSTKAVLQHVEVLRSAVATFQANVTPILDAIRDSWTESARKPACRELVPAAESLKTLSCRVANVEVEALTRRRYVNRRRRAHSTSMNARHRHVDDA